jgi:hypothetical protein
MANYSLSEAGASTQPDGLDAELDMALNIMRFVTDAQDAELAQYVHGKVCDSYRRIAKLSSQSQSEDRTSQALQVLEQRIREFQTRPTTHRQVRSLA